MESSKKRNFRPRMPSSRDESLQFSSRTEEECCKILDTNRHTGLHADQVRQRQSRFGTNELELGQRETAWEKFIEQFQNPLIMLLFGSAFVSALVGQYDDAISIIITIVIVMTGVFCSFSCIRSRVSIDAVSGSAQ
jgi:Ca2+-transporting ATPase